MDRQYSLFVLAERIDWQVFDEKFGSLYSEKVRPGKPTRLLVGMHYLKYAFDESNKSVVAKLLENPYWQCFCGLKFFIRKPHCQFDSSKVEPPAFVSMRSAGVRSPNES